MANLSNINNKFLVTTGGNVLIGQTGAIGSSLLQVNGIIGVGSSNQTTLNQTSTHFFMDMTSSTSYFRNTSTAGGGFIFRNSNIGDFEFDNEFAGNIKFNTSNIERMRINSSGDVGIGTTPEGAGPTWRTLFVGSTAVIVSRQSAAGHDSIFANNYYVNSSNQDRVRVNAPSSRMFLDGNNIRFQISPTNSTAPSWSEIMRIDANGNVGIGANSPADKLTVNGNIITQGANTNTGYDRYLKLYGSSDPATNTHRWAGIGLYNNGGNNVNELGFFTGSGDSARTEKLHIGSSGDIKITTNGKFLQGVRNTGSATIDMIGFVGGTDTLQIKGGTSGAANAISFYDTGGFIGTWYNGNFGIGTTSPGTFLQLGTYAVAGKYINQATYPDIPSEHMMHITAPSTNAYYGGGISFGETAFTAANIVVRDAGGSGALDLCFGTGSLNGMTERMRIQNNGNVGIGTTGPIAQLDVAGNTNQHHSVSTNNNGGWKSIQNLGVTSWLDQTFSAGRLKVFGYENGNVNVSYCEYYVIRSSTGYYIQQIGTRLDVGNTHGQVECQVSGNFLQVRNVAQSSLGVVRVVFSGMKN